MQTHEKIRELREAYNWTQEDMANKVAMSANGYAKIERGETRITLQRLEQFAQIFNIDISELLNGKDSNLVIQIEKNNKNNISVYGLSSDLTAEIDRLKLIIQHKDEVIDNLKNVITRLDQQIEDLRAANKLLNNK